MLSGQRHAPHRPLKQLVRTDNVGAGMHWLGGRVWVGERAGRKTEVEGGVGGVEKTSERKGRGRVCRVDVRQGGGEGDGASR